MAPVLDVRDLWIGEGSAAACRGVSFAVAAREVLCIVGGEGAGKSQLLRCVGLDFPPSSGSVFLNGVDVTGCRADLRRQLRARSIELVHPPAPEGVHDSTVPDARTGLLLASSRRTTVPVAGMRQRIQIAKALTQGTDVLLLDEPFVGLETPVRRRVLELLDRLRNESPTAVVVASRDPRVAQLVGARSILVLGSGEVVESGLTDRVIEAPQHPITRGLVEERRSA